MTDETIHNEIQRGEFETLEALGKYFYELGRSDRERELLKAVSDQAKIIKERIF